MSVSNSGFMPFKRIATSSRMTLRQCSTSETPNMRFDTGPETASLRSAVSGRSIAALDVPRD